jgi:hypothetical protein
MSILDVQCNTKSLPRGRSLILYTLLVQHHQRVCAATEGRAQGVPAEGAAAAAQGQVAVRLPPAARLLCGAVPREGPQPYRTRHHVPAQVLAQSTQPQGGEQKPVHQLYLGIGIFVSDLQAAKYGTSLAKRRSNC